jgi:hypothetical protein
LKRISLIILVLISGCSKYQVVSEVRVNMYHLHNPRTKEIEIIITKDSLIIGKLYRLNSINQIEIK